MTLKEIKVVCSDRFVKMGRPRKEVTAARKRNSLGSRAIGRTNRIGSASTTVATSGTSNIRVVVRVRPENRREQEKNFRNVVKVVDQQMLIFDPKEEDTGFFFHGMQQKCRDLLKKPNRNLTFMFDRVFPNSATNQEIFIESTQSLINSLMDGYNCSVFAYGATGAGKTHTMTGSSQNPGITFLTMTELFKKQSELSSERNFELGITYLEVYNELVKDLLNPGPPLQLREEAKLGVTVAGIKMFKINEPNELFDLLVEGNKNRTQHPTDANSESSRSHAVFQVYIRMSIKGTGQMRQAKLSMVDLAGSEKGSATNFNGARFTEGANINKSLLALGNCINSLADGLQHVPYRNSKLTRLLKDSLGGNCHTVMIANISPSSLSFEDTYNTLKYATRAKKIKTELNRNIVNIEMHTAQYVKMTEELKQESVTLKKENSNLKAKLEEQCNVNKELEKEMKELQSKLESLTANDKINTNMINNGEEILKKIKQLSRKGIALIDREYNYRIAKDDRKLRQLFKKEAYHEASHLCASPYGQKKLQDAIDKFETENIDDDIECVKNQKIEIINKLNSIKEEHVEFKSSVEMELLRMMAREERFKYENEKNQCLTLVDHHEAQESLLNKMADLLKTCYLQLKGHDYVSKTLEKKYHSLISEIQGQKKVTFQVPDSGISSTTSITTSDDVKGGGDKKRKLEEEQENCADNLLDLTFNMVPSSTPAKPKAEISLSPISKAVKGKSPRLQPSFSVKRGHTSAKSPKNRGITQVDKMAKSLANRPRFKF